MQAVGAGAQEFQKAHIPQNLQLLSDLRLDVLISGVEFGQGVGVGVDVGKREFHFAQGLHDLKDVEGPAAFFYL